MALLLCRLGGPYADVDGIDIGQMVALNEHPKGRTYNLLRFDHKLSLSVLCIYHSNSLYTTLAFTMGFTSTYDNLTI
jgi:hypothetical protein